MNFDAIRDFLKYTMTFALAGWAYTQAALGAPDAFFGASPDVARWIGGAVLVAFLASILLGLFFLSGTTGMASFARRAEEYERARQAMNAARLFRGEDPIDAVAGEPENRAEMARYERSAERNARWHFRTLGLAFAGAGLLFVAALVDGSGPDPDCTLAFDAGALVVDRTCLEDT